MKMKITFDKCSDALNYAIKTKTFGVFHSRESSYNQNIHTHECCEIFLCIEGGKSFLIDGKVYDVNDGDLFFMNQFEAHKITFLSNTEVERYVLQVHPEFLLSFSSENTNLASCFYNRDKYNKIPLEKKELSVFLDYFKVFEKDNGFGDDIIKQSTALLLISKLNALASAAHDKTAFLQPDKSLTAAMDYIDGHFRENITLETVAKNSYISVTQLCRLFKVNLGTTAAKYITGKRISEAKKLLRRGMSVSDTAFECGFNDYSNFIRVFSSHVGISPGKYSKSIK